MMIISVCVALLLGSCRAKVISTHLGTVAVRNLPQVTFGASADKQGLFNAGLFPNQDPEGSLQGVLFVPFSDNAFGDLPNHGQEFFVNPGVSGINPFITNFGSDSVNSLGSNGDFFGNSFGVNSDSPFGFDGSSGGPFDDLRGPLGAFGNSFGVPFGIEPFPGFSVNGAHTPFINDFASSQLPRDFVESNSFDGFRGDFPGSVNAFDSSFGGPLGSGFLPSPGVIGSVNPFITNFGNGPAGFIGGNDDSFDTSLGANSHLPGRF
ncbi:uncharacterized protein [Cherax quadricarinatus]|uniref:uncharacterized protein n=1 Tax=Cherax quadricarinatus TaxID=27406 RepID=UPI00387E4F8E